MARLRSIPPELGTAALAAAALAASLILPWYQKSFVPEGARTFVQDNITALEDFSFVEAAILLVAGAVVYLVWARSAGKRFALPGGDGVAISLAGAWAVLLLVWRLFDQPGDDGPATTVGIQWGIFGALLAAATLVTAGARLRATHRPEPTLREEHPRPRPHARPDRRPADPEAVTRILADRPQWSGEPPEPR